jgi:glycosyltransferase involved in cell wall biosynthesis
MAVNPERKQGRIRILHVAATGTGGVGMNILLLSKHMNKDRFDISVAMALGSSFDVEIKKEGVTIYPVHMSRAPLKLSNIMGLYELWKLIGTGKFDVVHTHTSVGGFIGRIAARLRRVPVVLWSIHGWAFNYRFGRFRNTFFKLIEKFLNRFTDHYIAVASNMVDIGVRAGITSPEKVSVIYHGFGSISCDREGVKENLRKSYGISVNDVIVGIVCRIEPQKAVGDFLKAAAIVEKKIPNACFLVVGDGPQRGEMEKMAEEMGIMDRVVFTGWRRNVKDYIRIIDVLCITSLWEAFPFLMLEAMALETPIVATCVGGIPEIIENGKTGNARRRQEQMFSIDKMIVQYEKMYIDLLQKANVIE